ncbi:MAG: hypothetical protein H7312_03235 [Tardiphaga sp.]|nr:hypothetical protein [Tardiphaga sp.]
MGLLVCDVDVEDGNPEHAKRLGADLVINAETDDPATIVKKEISGGAYRVMITAPSLPAFKQGSPLPQTRDVRTGRPAAWSLPVRDIRPRSRRHHLVLLVHVDAR